MWKVRAIGNNYEIVNQEYGIVAVGTKENLNLFEQIVNEHNRVETTQDELYDIVYKEGYDIGYNNGWFEGHYIDKRETNN